MELIYQLPQITINIVLLIAVVLLKFIINQLPNKNRNSFFSLYCIQLSAKVNKDSHSQNHKKIAGCIATLITFIPIFIILWLFESLIEVTWLWSALLLYFSLGSVNYIQVARKITMCLNAQDKYQAKQLLAPLILRDTESLSPIGINKAIIEMLIGKKFQLQFVVGFYFLLAGPLAAFSYRLLLEMHYNWNIKRAQYQYFGHFIYNLVNIFQWLPGRIYLFLLVITTLNQSVLLYLQAVKNYFFQLNNNVLLGYFAYSLSTKLGGVAMYKSHKLRRISFNDKGRQPDEIHVLKTIKQLNLINTLILGLLISILVILVLLTHLN